MKTNLKNQMTRDENKNKIQLETINVNKTIVDKRRGMESKEKINWRVDMNFYTANTQSKKEREGKERKKRKVILGQTMSDHHTCAIRRWRGRQNESMIR